MKFICNCGQQLANIKQLLDHYSLVHPEVMKRYKIAHKPSDQTGLIYAPSAELACQGLGWKIKNCKVVKQTS